MLLVTHREGVRQMSPVKCSQQHCECCSRVQHSQQKPTCVQQGATTRERWEEQEKRMWHVILNGNSCACRQEAGEHCLFPDNFATNKPTGITQVHVTYLHGMPPALELSLLPAIMSYCPGNSTDSHSGNYRSLPMGKHVASARK